MDGATDSAPHRRCQPGGGRRAVMPGMIFMMDSKWEPRGGPRGRHRRRRGAKRGETRAAILLLLAEAPRNGYQLMQELEERSGGVWRPSPGSVYPALALLEDEGLVTSTEIEGRKALKLTEEGVAHVEERREQLGTPWEAVTLGSSDELHQLRESVAQTAAAAMHVAQSGSKEQLGAARTILEDARRALYRLLAD